ncbi:hypothetical protein [Halobacterium bonnevillei]|uniref:Sulfatase N-terminal domain-containing protein n=1 Tax=Halobacterium bonnevillei TaxID=2692200 RepID=A0A6B0SRK1_9EURY|nr:hypothetical protein [Halobacterium bonnevillei]MXR20229.1 hypothetical protein [Halobacterium bonnevillei]
MLPIRKVADIYREEGLREVLSRARDWAGYGLVKRLQGPKEGVNVVEEDWDNLIILDACRYDAFESVNNLSGRLERRTSQAAVTWSFLKQNFENRQLYDSVYVAANAVVGENVDRLDVFKLVGLWKSSDQDRYDVVEPTTVVQEALSQNEKYPDKRLIVHFLQPHTPFLLRDGERIPADSPYRNFDAVRRGDVSESEIRQVYEENVTNVLNHVEKLVENLDGKTVVTADHGELLGEGIGLVNSVLHPRWPFSHRRNFKYGHYSHIRMPELVEVPWLVIDSEQRRDIVAADKPEGMDMETDSIKQQLEALGYRT